MDPILKAALGQPARTFTAVRAELPDGEITHTLCLLNGGQAVVGGETYLGLDDRFGAIDKISSISDGVSSEATTVNMTLSTATAGAIEVLANPRTQGAPITITQGVIDTDTGGVVGTELLFRGEINYSVLVADEEMRAVRVELITEEARALEPNDERRLSHAFHQSVWPGELGLIHATGVTQKDFWRVRKPAVSYSGGNGLIGGGGGGNHNYGLTSLLF